VPADHCRSHCVIQQLGPTSKPRPDRLKQNSRVERVPSVMLRHGFGQRQNDLIAIPTVEDSSTDPKHVVTMSLDACRHVRRGRAKPHRKVRDTEPFTSRFAQRQGKPGV
jgi:hypothetical protein